MVSLLEPLETTPLSRLSMKTEFLVAVASARRVSELQALLIDPSYMVFYKDNLSLSPHPKFIPKVV